jgi:hypothetical protein
MSRRKRTRPLNAANTPWTRYVMPFGAYRGRTLPNVPDNYIGWLLSIELRDPLLSAVQARARHPQDARQWALFTDEPERTPAKVLPFAPVEFDGSGVA